MPNSKPLTTQQQILVDYLSKGRTLTNKVALTCLGVGSLSSRMAELRRLGYDIETERKEDPLTHRWYQAYRFPRGEPDADPEESGVMHGSVG